MPVLWVECATQKHDSNLFNDRVLDDVGCPDSQLHHPIPSFHQAGSRSSGLFERHCWPVQPLCLTWCWWLERIQPLDSKSVLRNTLQMFWLPNLRMYLYVSIYFCTRFHHRFHFDHFKSHNFHSVLIANSLHERHTGDAKSEKRLKAIETALRRSLGATAGWLDSESSYSEWCYGYVQTNQDWLNHVETTSSCFDLSSKPALGRRNLNLPSIAGGWKLNDDQSNFICVHHIMWKATNIQRGCLHHPFYVLQL